MPRTPEENERIKKEKKERILAAGLKVFAKNGLEAAKMSDIAKAANVSYGLVYNYFPSKVHIFVALVNDAVSSSHEMIAQLKRMQLPPSERMKKIFLELYNFYSHAPEGMLFYIMMLQLTFHPRLWKKLAIKDIRDEPVFQFIFETLKEGQRSGEFMEGNPQEIVLLLGYIALSFSLRGQAMFQWDVKAENIVNLIMRMIKK